MGHSRTLFSTFKVKNVPKHSQRLDLNLGSLVSVATALRTVQQPFNILTYLFQLIFILGWRVVAFSPTYTMEGTEDIEDETFLRRHQKFELDEKKRKRWDIQRMREQRHVEKLRAR